jgi:hypothetical protein
MAWWLIALQTAQPVTDREPFDLADTARRRTTHVRPQRCDDAAPTDEIVVCGNRADRYRLPLPLERATSERGKGEARSGTAAMTPYAKCGMFAGERQCGKREAADYGYGNGRDPVTIITRLAKKAIDPDAD